MINLSRETEVLAQRVASVQRLSPDDAIRLALEEKARVEGITLEPRQQTGGSIVERRARTDGFLASLDAMPIRDPRSPREIMDDINAL